jgi:hypothetical protein
MKVIRPNCRAQFTAADYAFVATVLPVREAGGIGLIRLVEDADHLDHLLDQPRLFRAVLDLPNCLTVSLHFYFYVLVRQALLREQIQDRDGPFHRAHREIPAAALVAHRATIIVARNEAAT